MNINLEKYDLKLSDDTLLRTFEGVILKGREAIITYFKSLNINQTLELNPYASFLYAEDDNYLVKVKHDKNIVQTFYCMLKDQPLTRYFGTLAYDGSHYYGFQRQNKKNSIQATLESVLNHLFQSSITIHASGRTDKGVHSFMQPFHFDGNMNIPLDQLKRLINKMLPNDIKLEDLKVVPNVFHARYDALEKTYQYRFDKTDNPFYAHYKANVNRLNLTTFKENLLCFKGTHDFSNFAKSQDKENIRTIHAISIEETPEEIIVEITGNGFLRYMVRMMIGAALNLSKAAIIEALNNPNIQVPKHVADACGLYLKQVKY